jgi:superfamily I DNA/RNA helicase
VGQVVVAKSFLDSTQGLGANERARALDLIAKLYDDPRHPGLHLEKVQSGGPGIHSARVTGGLRAILHVDGANLTLLYAGEHESAYNWARGRRFEPNAVTGELQIVQTVERVEEVLPEAAQVQDGSACAVRLFPVDRFADDYLLSLGVPPDWLPVVRHLTEDTQLLEIAEKLPQEVGERLFRLADGEVVTPPAPVATDHATGRALTPDEQRSFIVVGDAELAEILSQPLDAWLRFLHPSQRALATGKFAGPVKVTGSAGTGKTVVGLHRVRYLVSQGQRVLLTSFVTTLCDNLGRNLKLLLRPEELRLATVSTVHAQAVAVVNQAGEKVVPLRDEELLRFVETAHRRMHSDLDAELVAAEWAAVIDAQGIATWDEYRDAERRGRGRPLTVKDRKRMWAVIEQLRADLAAASRDSFRGICARALRYVSEGRVASPFDAVVVDEVQDLKPIELRFLAALATSPGAQPNLMLLGDAGQRIYPGGFSLRALGIDVRGRSKILRINYRTTEQIRRAADRILENTCDDLDEGAETRSGTRSLLRGPTPVLQGFGSSAAEADWVAERIQSLRSRGLAYEDIAVFARTRTALDALRAHLGEHAIPRRELSDEDDGRSGGVSLGTMHRAKGLEFKVVFVAACSKGLVPIRSAERSTADAADREIALERERSVLYVSLTRARDEAFVTWTGEPSPFLARLLPGGTATGAEAER